MPTIRTQLELIDNMSNRFEKIEAAARRSASAGEQLEAAYASSSGAQQMDYMESKLNLQERALEQQGAGVEALREKYESLLMIHSKDSEKVQKISTALLAAEMSELRLQQSANATADSIDKQKIAALAVTQALEQTKLEQEATWCKAETMSSEFANVVTEISSKLASMSGYSQGMDLEVFKATEIEKYSNQLDKVQLDLLKVRNAETALKSVMNSDDINQINQSMKNYDENLIKLVTSNQGAVNATERLKSAEWQRVETLEQIKRATDEAYVTAISKAEMMSSEFSATVTEISSKLASMSGYAQGMDLEIFKAGEMEKYSAQLDRVNSDLFAARNAQNALNSALESGNINTVNQAIKKYETSTMKLVASNQGAVNATERLRAAEWQRVEVLEQTKRAQDAAYTQGAYEKTKQQVMQMQAAQKGITGEIQRSSVAQRNFSSEIQTSRGHTGNLLSELKKILGVYISISSARSGAQTVDAYSSNGARVKMVNDGLQTQAELQQKIYDAAQRSRSGYNDMVGSVAKLNMLAGKAFKSNDEAIVFTELMNKAFKVSGASAQESKSAMYQLTQAMAAGKLQGDEFRSIMENAPMLAQAIADYTGKGVESLKELSSNGLISADIVKNALFSAGDDIEKLFAELPITFSDLCNHIKNKANREFGEVMQNISNMLNSETGQQLISCIDQGIESLAAGATELFEIVYNVGAAFADWEYAIPVLSGLAGAIAGYNIGLALSAILSGAAAFGSFLHGVGLIGVGIATGNATIAQNGLNMAMAACPLMWIAMAIGIVAMAFFGLSVKSIGLKATILSVNNAIQSSWEWLVETISFCVMHVKILFNTLHVASVMIGNKLDAFMGNIASDILMTIQDTLNLAIKAINDFIGLLNGIPGVSIKAISDVTFATEFDAYAAARKQANDAKLDDLIASKESENKAMEKDYNELVEKNNTKQAAREKEIEDAVNEFKNKKDSNEAIAGVPPVQKNPNPFDGTLDGIGKNTEKIKENTKKAEDDLKWLKDIAEQEQINRFTTATLAPQFKVEIANVNQNSDIDGITDRFTADFREMVAIAAEGA